MQTPPLYAPWRIDYIKGLSKPPGGSECFLCAAARANDAAANRSSLVLWHSEYFVVLLNRYPYANGHLLVAPKIHKADLEELTPPELADLPAQTVRAVKLLKRTVSAQGFNVGINLGRVAGAGVPGHLHQHVVPRWGGDVNFMHVIADVGVIPQTNEQLYEALLAELAAE